MSPLPPTTSTRSGNEWRPSKSSVPARFSISRAQGYSPSSPDRAATRSLRFEVDRARQEIETDEPAPSRVQLTPHSEAAQYRLLPLMGGAVAHLKAGHEPSDR